MPPSLSIIIPSYDRLDLLRACLRSTTAHAPPNSEIIVVDDGSPDSGPTKLIREFPGVHGLRLPRRGGFAVAANTGWRAARGEIVELLNDDTEVTPGWAEAALDCFADQGVAAVAPMVLFHPAALSPGVRHLARLDSAGDRYYCGGVAAKRGHGQRLTAQYLRPCRVFGASASSGFYRRHVLESIGGFPESFGAYFEDVDLAFRLHWSNWQTVYQPLSLVYHHVGSSYGRKSRKLLEIQSRNEERVFWRNMPRNSLYRALPCHLAVLAAKAWRRWRQGELFPFILGRLRLFTEIGELRRHRQQLRSTCANPKWRSWCVEASYWQQAGAGSPCRPGLPLLSGRFSATWMRAR